MYFGIPAWVLPHDPKHLLGTVTFRARGFIIVQETRKENDVTTQYQSNPVDNAKSRIRTISWQGLYNVGGAAGVMTGIILLTAMICLIISVLQPNARSGWLLSFQNIWLVEIFKLHSGFNGVHITSLHVLNYLDIAILAIVGTMYLGLYHAFKRTSKIWALIAAIQPFLGIVIFIATKNAGRSGVMGAALVISVVMRRSCIFNKPTAYIGILTSVLLLVGDFSAGVIPPSTVIATLVGIGYVLLMMWHFLVARKLFQLGMSER